jgi:hypothetical protein
LAMMRREDIGEAHSGFHSLDRAFRPIRLDAVFRLACVWAVS